jgi:hypothetical protein
MPYDYGSQYQLRRWVLERTDEFNAHLRRASPTLDEWVDDIAWIAPVAEDHHELRDEAWSAAGLPTPSPQDAGWWPQRGPVWDAVAEATGRDGQAGAIFVEAKGRESELRSWGSRATDPEGISAIRSALADVQAALETPSASTGWDPRISRRTGWRCCTSRVANGSRPCPSGWSPCTCAASATNPSAGSSGQPTRKRGGRSAGPCTTRWGRRTDAPSCPIGGSSCSSQRWHRRGRRRRQRHGSDEREGSGEARLIVTQPERLGCSRAARRASASIARRAFSGLSSISPDRQACT